MEIKMLTQQVLIKIVYYGPGLSGKTTNLEAIHKKIPEDKTGKLTAVATNQDRTLFFDYMAMELGEIRGLKIRLRLFTVPGQVYYNATRKLVLKSTDGVVFVADSSREKREENIEAFENLKENLAENDFDWETIPLVLQFNKRDLPDAMSIEEMEKDLNAQQKFTVVPAIAYKGTGVFTCLKAVANATLTSIDEQITQKKYTKKGSITKKRKTQSLPQLGSLKKKTRTKEFKLKTIDLDDIKKSLSLKNDTTQAENSSNESNP